MGIKNRYEPWQIPDNLCDYVQLVSQSDGIGKIPGAKLGTEIAIIGAGCAGLCAAYELRVQRSGLKNSVSSYKSASLNGL